MKPIKPILMKTIVACFLLAGPFAGPAQDFTSGLLGYYPLSGDATDHSGNGNNGTVLGASLTSDPFGNPNSAYSFNGYSSHIDIPYAPGFNIASNGQFTISLWAKPSANNNGNSLALFVKGDFDYGLYYWGPNQFGLGSGWGPSVSTPTMVVPGTWYHVVGTYSDGTFSIYVNGAVLGTVYDARAIRQSLGGSAIGRKGTSVMDYFPGSIDEVRFYNRALSGAEVEELYDYESGNGLGLSLFNISLTMYQQSSSKTSGSITTTASPKTVIYATKDILNVLAFDENLKGNWPSNSFPASASLALAGQSLAVIDAGLILLNVSDIMSLSFGDNRITSGKHNNVTGLASPSENKRQLAKINFDDTSIIGSKSLKFSLQGFLSQTTTDTTPVAGVYTETVTVKITSGSGEGISQNVPFVCTGAATATGTNTFSF
jgi:hypothetical protein